MIIFSTTMLNAQTCLLLDEWSRNTVSFCHYAKQPVWLQVIDQWPLHTSSHIFACYPLRICIYRSLASSLMMRYTTRPRHVRYRSITIANFLGGAVKRGLECSDLNCLQVRMLAH